MNITGSTAARAVLSNAINNRATTRQTQNTAGREGAEPASEERTEGAAAEQAESAVATTGSVGRQINLFA